jgi:hypothetical protein
MNKERLFGIAVVSLLFATPASAQGNGNGHAYGLQKNRGTTGAPSAAGSPELHVSGTGVRAFGSWLDDASMMGEGIGSMSLAFGYWRTPEYREVDFPVVDASYGVTPRVQVGFSMPFYHASQPGGAVARGIGDLYLSGKIQLRDPSTGGRRVGFSTTPLVEILTYAPRPDASRFGWAIPGNIEIRGTRWRTFGSAGYFSRGAFFASGAIEAALTNRAWVTGSISRSHSIEKDDLSVALGLTQSRTDVSGGMSVVVGPAISVFGSAGRTISRQDANSATFTLTMGMAYAFSTR